MVMMLLGGVYYALRLVMRRLLRQNGFCRGYGHALGLSLEGRGGWRDGSEHLVGVVRGNHEGLLLGADHVPEHVFELERHIRFLLAYLSDREGTNSFLIEFLD